jgi:hypothetical protein
MEQLSFICCVTEPSVEGDTRRHYIMPFQQKSRVLFILE